GKILDQWERRGPAAPPDVCQKDRKVDGESSAARRKRLRGKHPDGTIDLHGLTQREAWEALDHFFQTARKQGFEKLLIIHGKGNHTGDLRRYPDGSALPLGNDTQGILKNTAKSFIERCPFAGESGYSGAAQGGTGSTWVLLKPKNRG
ncbi:MAG: Smr/MutS family protein, partial [Treponema sp.]|nr:Smr/MutS family protein [Treponema sp.]